MKIEMKVHVVGDIEIVDDGEADGGERHTVEVQGVLLEGTPEQIRAIASTSGVREGEWRLTLEIPSGADGSGDENRNDPIPETPQPPRPPPAPGPSAASEADGSVVTERLHKVIADGLREIAEALDANEPELALRDAATVLLDLAGRTTGGIWNDRLCRTLAVRLEQLADDIENREG